MTVGVMPLGTVKRALAATFLLNGFAYAAWLSRLPALRDRLELSPSAVGLLLLCLSLGTVVALPASGWVVARLGTRRTIRGGAILVIVGLLLLSAAGVTGSVPAAAVAMFAYGVGTSSWDVAMNVEGSTVERLTGKTVLPRFHAAFSLGTILGALSGALAATTSTSLLWQLSLTAGAVALGVGAATPRLLPAADDPVDQAGRSALLAWRERRTLLLGLLVLAFALSEGLANDWLALAMVDAYGASEAAGALTFACFVSTMTLGRVIGGGAVDRWGRVRVLRGTAVLVGIGAAMVSAGSVPVLAVVGALLWGLGTSLGFPLGMSAAGEDERHASARVAVVGSVGYAAFLGGPPLVGFLAEAVGIRQALLVAVLAATAALVLSPVANARPAR